MDQASKRGRQASNILTNKKYGDRINFDANRKYSTNEYYEVCDFVLSEYDIPGVETILQQACEAMWYFAFSKPVDMGRYKKVVEIQNYFLTYEVQREKYQEILLIEPIEVLLADIYIAKEFGESVLNAKRDKMNQWLDYHIKTNNYRICYELASALKALHIYKLEAEVLRRIVSSGLSVGEDLQERIRFIENVGDNYVEVYQVEPQKNLLQLDYSTISWREDDYVKFFRTLAYENMSLQYSLTIREWTSNLTIEGECVELEALFACVTERFKSEYLDSVKCIQREFELLSENGAGTKKKGLLVMPEKAQVGFEHVALLLNIITFGRNLNLRIYTLFMPVEKDMERQKQQILSLKNNNSPEPVVFEEGAKTTILKTIEDYINGSGKDISSKPLYQDEKKNEQQLF